MYFDIRDELPFPFSDSNDLLQEKISSFDEKSYYADLDHFFNETFGTVCNGDASKKVCAVIEKVIEKKH